MKQCIGLAMVILSCAFLPASQAGLIAQNPPIQEKIHPPTIGLKLMMGDLADFGNTQIKFKKVIEDSRCPKDVQCVWAGEAKVLVEVYENGAYKEDQELTFGALTQRLAIINKDLLGVEALKLQPYPESSIPKDQMQYYLVLGVRKN